MFGLGKKKRITIVAFTKVGDRSVAARMQGELTKREVLKKVGKWWDNHGTRLDDYDGIQITAERTGD